MAGITLPRRLSTITPGLLAWIGLLGVLLLIGLVSAVTVLLKGLIVTNMNNTVPWGLWITVDLSAIALGAGAFTLSAVVYVFGLKRFQPIVRLAVFVGFIGYTSALLALVMDIGRPDRFWHPWVYWNVHSVLWEITWAITLYTSVMVLEFIPVVVELPFFGRWPRLRRLGHILHKATPALALIGMGISLLHQSSLGATYGILKARPIWFKPSMPIMFILSAVAVGPAVTMGVALVVEWITQKRTVPHDALRIIARFSAFALLVYLYIKLWDLAAVSYYGRSPAVISGMDFLQQITPYGFGFWVGEIIIGVIIPVMLFLTPRFNRRPPLLVLGAFCGVIGILFNRWDVTVSGLVVPLSYAPGVLYKTPPGSYTPALVEWGVAIGVLGYALTMLTVGVKLLPLFPREGETH